MKRFYLFALITLVASVVLVAAIEVDPGYLLISYGLYTLETSIWMGLAIFLLLIFVLYILFSLLRNFINQSQALQRWFSDRGYRRSQQQTARGLIAFTEGNWKQAKRTLSRVAEKSETPLLNYLIAARASNALGEKAEVKEFLKKAEASTSGAGIAVDLTQAELQLQSGEYEQALATLMRIRRNAAKHPFVLKLLMQVYAELKDWPGMLELLPELKKHRMLDDAEFNSLELQTCKGCIAEVAKARDNTLNELNNLWARFSKAMTTNSELVLCFIEYIVQYGGEAQAEKMIRDQLKRDWHKGLVELYGRVQAEDVAKQLLHAERWLQERNNDPTLLLSLGRLSIRNSLWGKAKEYFESSLKLEESAIVCAELGRLLAHLGEYETSNNYFQRGLINASALPELPMPERAMANNPAVVQGG